MRRFNRYLNGELEDTKEEQDKSITSSDCVKQIIEEFFKGIAKELYPTLNEITINKIKVNKFVPKKGCKINAHLSLNAGPIIFFA